MITETDNDPDDYRERLNQAASAHAEHQLAEYPILTTNKLFRVILEIAFIQGATWYNGVIQQRTVSQLAELKSELREVLSRAH